MSKKDSNPWQIATILLVGLILGYGLSGFSGDETLNNVQGDSESIVIDLTETTDDEESDSIGTTAPELIEVSVDDDAGLGDPNAPVTIVEFSDFQCPFCRSSYNELLPSLKENYIDEGLVYFVYRDYPLNFHADAQKAAEATECARDQDKFWEMHDAIFDGQNALGNGTVSIPYEDLKQYAVDLDLDADEFNECLDSGEYASEVLADVQDGVKYGVSGTPTFFINGYKVVGAQPYSTISSVIDSFL